MAVFPVWTVVTLLMMLYTRVTVEGVPTQNLHRHMSKKELQYYFNVNDHDKVPEYHVTNPYQSNDAGDFVAYSMHQTRAKRSPGRDGHSFYKLNAFGSKLHLKLKKNEHLMAPGMKILRQNSDGTVTSNPAPENTFYIGHVVSDPRSTVAVSNNGGLTGIVKTSRETLFVHPLPAHLAKHVTSSDEVTPHLVYRRSLRNDALYPTIENEENSRFSSSLEAEDFSKNYPVPKFKTLKVGLMCPTSLVAKYSSGNLYKVTGGAEKFLLLLANMVAGMYQDPSIGEIKLTYVVTNVTVIEPAKLGFTPQDSSDTKLTKLVRKVASDNKVQKVAFDVFSYVSNAITGGALASVNTICNWVDGNVNQDIGLQTALHIAHETGHNFGLGHDSGACAAQSYIMKSDLPGGEHATEWSECSRNALQRLLKDEARSDCLDDSPFGDDHPTLPPNFREKLPGKVVDGDMQCEMNYGEGWKRYRTTQCAVLYCIKDYTLLSKNAIVGDGTECGLNRWCIKGKCEHSGIPINAIDGGWSEWSSYTNCTHKCGGGVQHKKRHCNNPKPFHGKPCHGRSREYRICNPQDCPSGEKDYRQLQCDQKMPGTPTYYFERDVCGVYCRAGSTITKIGTVPDGYRCTRNKKDFSVCIDGNCRPVGCDHVLDSKTVEDRCGVCGGDGNTCTRVRSLYTDSPSMKGPDNAALITELPMGTKGALFVMANNTLNYLGVQDANGSYIVGGHLGGNQVKPAAGTLVHYRHKRRKPSQDSITITGPTKEVLRVVYVKKSDKSGGNPGVGYHYLVLGLPDTSSDGFKWVTGSWSACSRTCAVGIRRRDVRCVRVDDESPASDSACPGKMPNVEPCNTQPCAAKWTFSKWTPCSKTCGMGHQQRQLRCLEEVAPNDFRETNSCSAPKPTGITSVGCNRYPCPAEWHTRPWSACSTQCAIGTKHRQVLCSRVDEAGNFSVIAEEFCRYLNKPPTQAACNEDLPCGPRPPLCPHNHHCSNGGTCASNPAGYKCICKKGFAGLECEIKLDPCVTKPCSNGGSCSPGVSDHWNYTCQCLPRFTGRNCETKITACMSNPCMNGATCADNGSFSKYTCTCLAGYLGEQCQVSTFYHIGCFNHDNTVMPPLDNRKRELDIDKVASSVIKCAEQAQDKGYKYFSVGLKEACYSGPKAGETYFKKGPAPAKKKCTANGVGKKGASVVYTFEPVPAYEQLGCFRAIAKKKKPLGIKYIKFSNQGNKKKQTTIDQCARVARAKGYTYFAVQNTAECWSDNDAKDRYQLLGPSGKCKDGVGLKGANMVYRFTE
ncbi:A disintegrin and metalloproteinase with thrombospondin motifs 6-like [Oculina patagonica]